MRILTHWLIDVPESLSRYFTWLGPLFARIVVGWVFMWSGWEKLHALPQITANFVSWGIPFPQIVTPFVSGVEFFGGLFLLLGRVTRSAGVPLVVVMIVAIISAKWDHVDSLETLLGFEEVSYMALFGWLAIAGPGPISFDYLLQKLHSNSNGRALSPSRSVA